MALIEPSISDGQLSESERQAILSIASKALTKSQTEELEKLIVAVSANVKEPAAIFATGRSDNGPTSAAKATGSSNFSKIMVVDATAPANQGIAAACDSGDTGICDNLSLFGTFEGFKGPVDLGDHNGNFGFRIGANWAYPVWEACGLGVQLGTAATWADFEGTELSGSDDRFQSFTTLGLFQRLDCGVNWAVAYDFLWDDYYVHINLRQLRAQVGYELGCDDEIGIWATMSDNGDRSDIDIIDPDTGLPVTTPVHFDAMNQSSLFWRHTWCNSAETRVWAGLADDHGEWVFGGDFRVPLSDQCALIGEANFIKPSASGFPVGASEEIWSLSMGIAIYPKHTATHAGYSRYAPLLPVANNGTFAVDRLPE
jgi:hypothetical protein